MKIPQCGESVMPMNGRNLIHNSPQLNTSILRLKMLHHTWKYQVSTILMTSQNFPKTFKWNLWPTYHTDYQLDGNRGWPEWSGSMRQLYQHKFDEVGKRRICRSEMKDKSISGKRRNAFQPNCLRTILEPTAITGGRKSYTRPNQSRGILADWFCWVKRLNKKK